MANILHKDEMVRVLTDAGVVFDPAATMIELRPLYDEVLRRNAVRMQDEPQLPEENGENSSPDAQQTPPTEANSSAQLPSSNSTNTGATRRESWADLTQREEAELDRQIELLRKKKELVKLQQELNELDSRKIDLHVLDAVTCKFNGSELQDVKKWFANLENVFEMFRYSERDKLVAANHLDKKARTFVEFHRGDPKLMTYEQFKREVVEEFHRAYTVQDVFKQLRARVMKPDETPRSYVIEMQHIASRADVPEVDLIDIIIDGLNGYRR